MVLKDVEKAIRRVRVHIHSYQLYAPGSQANRGVPVDNAEMSTRYIVIDPVLRSLGWDLSNPSECVVECIAGDQGPRNLFPRVDYALRGRDGRVAVLVEAKRISESVRADPLDVCPEWCEHNRDDSHCQIRRYLRWVPNVRVGILTNGREWQIFLPRDGRWEPDGSSVRLGSRTVKRNAQRLIEHLGRERYWRAGGEVIARS